MSSIFVFGSNTAGRHGKGAALTAVKEYGAKYGQGVGFQGNSYAIPTKNAALHSLALNYIAEYVEEFIRFAYAHPEYTFNVTPIGCGLVGYEPYQIAPMFKGVPENVYLPDVFKEYL